MCLQRLVDCDLFVQSRCEHNTIAWTKSFDQKFVSSILWLHSGWIAYFNTYKGTIGYMSDAIWKIIYIYVQKKIILMKKLRLKSMINTWDMKLYTYTHHEHNLI